MSLDQSATEAIIQNLSNTLKIARFEKNQSGWFKSVLQAYVVTIYHVQKWLLFLELMNVL